MLTDTLHITPAVPDDARRINEIVVQGRRQNYISPEHGLDEVWAEGMERDMLSEDGLSATVTAIEDAQLHPAEAIYLTARDDRDVPVAAFRALRSPDRQLVDILFVDSAHQGRGIGKMLMDRYFDWADPSRPTTLYVVEHNDQAITFYRRLGFEIVPGETGEVFGAKSYKMERGPTNKEQK